uniref:DNA-directed RNA polymerase III subunit RPC9 n=2 Tax=Rhizophora mucronata TaxID=61149 RepID=A0A2P2IL54_RHIMU
MKIIKQNAGALTNLEVLDFLRAKGASNDVSRVIAPVAPSEYKVYDYLVDSPACNQKREHISEFFEKCKRFNLAKAEMLNIINLRPSQLVELDPLIEQSDVRLGDQADELLELINQVLPPPPTQAEPEADMDEDKAQMEEGEKKP